MASLERAISIAVAAHSGQIEKGGAPGTPYVVHPLRLMNAVNSIDEKIVAVLHDVVEDTAVTMEQLRSEGFAETVLAALCCVTHDKAVPYADYVVKIKANSVAARVKIADLTDNYRLDRCLLRVGRAADDFARMRRYVLSYKYLSDQLSETDYRTLMSEYGEA